MHTCVTGAMGVPAPVHVPGDCYVWGSSNPNNAGSKPGPSSVPGWLNSSVPTLVDNTTHLDVCEVREPLSCMWHVICWVRMPACPFQPLASCLSAWDSHRQVLDHEAWLQAERLWLRKSVAGEYCRWWMAAFFQ